MQKHTVSICRLALSRFLRLGSILTLVLAVGVKGVGPNEPEDQDQNSCKHAVFGNPAQKQGGGDHTNYQYDGGHEWLPGVKAPLFV